MLRRIEAEKFLSFGQRIMFDVDSGLTVGTGPNGAGKSASAMTSDVRLVFIVVREPIWCLAPANLGIPDLAREMGCPRPRGARGSDRAPG